MAGKRKSGRPNKYETHVKPRLKEIEQMCLTMTDKQICEALGVHPGTWCVYKNKYPELNEAMKKGRESLVIELRETLIKKAKGYTYTEKKSIYENGELVKEEVYTKVAHPDVAAANLLLKNYDPDKWANDPQMLRLKEKELELQERKLEQSEW